MKTVTILALVFACACSSYTTGDTTTGGIPSGGDQSDAGDGGPDGGDGGPDAGPDAGCTALSLSGVQAIDGCLGGSPVTGSASVSVAAPDAGNACTVTIQLSTANTPCAGTASHGTLDAFDGGCFGLGTLACSSPSLPGTLTCTGGCTIRICDAGVCGP